MLSEKYIAGFLDADGCITLGWTKDCNRPQLRVSFSQKTSQDKVLYLIQEALGGSMREVTINDINYSHLTLCGNTARKSLSRIKKYLVIKRHYAEVCLDSANKRVENQEVAKQYLKEQRKVRSLPLPNFPSRKWLAGYFDGDGCLSISRLTENGGANIVAHLAASCYDIEGIEIIHKAFGGRINDMRNGHCRQWALSLAPSKAKQFLGLFAKHLVTKKSQAMFILGCAAMNHYRDGINIKAALKQLKAREHRLSESEMNIADLIKTVEDKLPHWKKSGGITVCLKCGSRDHRHMGRGLCSACYQRQRRQNSFMRQSELQATA